MSSFK